MPPQLTPLQAKVLAGLLAGGNISAVAREHNIHRSTIYNWRHGHQAFALALNEARAGQMNQLYDSAQDLASRAFETLSQLLDSGSESTRIRAAQAILRATIPKGVSPPAPAGAPQFAAFGPEAAREHLDFASVLESILDAERGGAGPESAASLEFEDRRNSTQFDTRPPAPAATP